MPGPWEKYQAAPTEEKKPWEKYGKPEAAAPVAYPKGIMEKISAGLHPERYEQMTPEQKKEYLKQGEAEYETSKKEGLKVGLMSLAAEAVGPFAGALKAAPYVG